MTMKWRKIKTGLEVRHKKLKQFVEHLYVANAKISNITDPWAIGIC